MIGDSKLTSTQLYEYIENNNLEYDATIMLVFNTAGFLFIPLNKPKLVQSEYNGTQHFAFGANEQNVLESKYQFHSMMLDLRNYRGGAQLLNHPENLYAYISMYQNNITLEYHYERRRKIGGSILRKAAIINFIESLEIDNIDELKYHIIESKNRMNTVFLNEKLYYSPRIGDEKIILDELVEKSYDKSNSKLLIPKFDIMKTNIRKGIGFAEKQLYTSLCITYQMSVDFPGYEFETQTGKVRGIVAQTTNVPKPKIKTPLDCDITIVNQADRISDILYNAALKIRATDFQIAVGYAYDSGLELILPALMSARYMADTSEKINERRAELVVGALQNYNGKSKIKQMSRASAQRINDLIKSVCIKHLYTCRDHFYHGKFYYIGSDTESYVIIGSSNITKSAYERNYEFDILYHFTNDEGCNRNLEKQFLEWLDNLIHNCIELNGLDESLFLTTTAQDESGANYKTSFFRTLESEEEKSRYSFLESFNPTRISEYAIKGRPFKAFKNYVLFEYATRGISILEGFSYGNSCYVLSVVRENDVKDYISWKSKEQVKNTDVYIADIQHDTEYESNLFTIFSKYKEDN